MTESEWLASEDPAAMLELLMDPMAAARAGTLKRHERPSDRKLRLFAVACFRATPPQGDQWGEFLQAVDQLEKAADVEPYVPDDLANKYFHPDWDALTLAGWAARGVPEAAALLREIVGNPFRPVTLPACPRCDGDGKAHGADRPFQWSGPGSYPGRCPVCQGRKSRVVTPAALSLAELAYEHRQPDGTLDPLTLAALADELEEAGCSTEPCPKCTPDWKRPSGRGLGWLQGKDSRGYFNIGCTACGGEDGLIRPEGTSREGTGLVPHPILEHLRSPGPHVRGCHIVDLVLGKD